MKTANDSAFQRDKGKVEGINQDNICVDSYSYLTFLEDDILSQLCFDDVFVAFVLSSL